MHSATKRVAHGSERRVAYAPPGTAPILRRTLAVNVAFEFVRAPLVERSTGHEKGTT